MWAESRTAQRTNVYQSGNLDVLYDYVALITDINKI